MAALRKVPLHRALTRPQLFAGGEREPMLLIGLAAFALVFAGANWTSAAIGVGLYFIGALMLRQMAKVDPMMARLFLRHVRYRPIYPAHPTIWAPARAPMRWS